MLLKYVMALLLIVFVFIQMQCEIPEVADITPPAVGVIYPYSGSILSGTTKVIVEATDDEEVTKVWLYLDDTLIVSGNGSSGTFDIDLSAYEDDQIHMIQAGARDESGNKGYSPQVLVTISDLPDNVPPTVSIINPQGGQQVQDTVTVLAAADDDRLVSEVAFFVNGDSLHSDNLYPYKFEWVTTGLADSTSHSIVAKAFDASGNWTYSTPITVTVFPRGDRTSPELTLLYPNEGSVISGTVDVVINAYDNIAVTSMDFFVDGKLVANDTNYPWGFSWTTDTLSVGTHILYVIGKDAAGNEGTTGNLLFTIADDPDVTPPVLTLLFPVAGTTVQGNVNVVVDVVDDSGVDSVQFFIDGVWDNTDTNSPWGFLWNTTGLDSGSHTLYMKGYDPVGNAGVLGPITFLKD